MEGLLAGGLAAPDRPRGPDRLPGPAPREDIDSGTEAAEGEGDIFRSAHYLPVTKEGPRDILDGRSGISDGQPHPGLSEALPRATSATHRISSCYWDGDSLDFQPGSPPPHLLGPFPASLDVQGSWEHPMVQEAGEGIQSEQRFEDSVIVRTMKPHAKLKVSRKFSNHRGELKFLEKYPPSHHKFDWLPDADKQGSLKDAGLHLDLPAKPPTVTSFRRVIVPVDDTPKTLDMEFMSTREDLEDFAGLTQPSEWGLHTSASEVATQTWTVNSEASVERLQPILPPVPTEPYLCELLQEVADGVDSREEEEEEEEEEPAVFPCIECSIYFRHKEHLLEHMSQHRRAPGQEPPAHLAPLACSECGWAFTEPTALEQHWQLHQASREKIIEEIQKLKRFPGDEGREARLQCPKCIFGTNSSRAFMQHAKLHVREILPGQQAKAPFRSSSPVIDISTLVYPSSGDSSGLDTCMYCGFRAPSKSLLGEHIRLVHAHWEEDGEAFEEILTSQPGTSQDARVHFPDTATTDYFGKSEPLLASVWQENPAGYDPSPAFGPDCHQPGVRDFPLLNSGQQPLGKLAFPSPAASASYPKPLNGSKSTVHLQRMGDKSHPWSDEEEEEDEGAVLTSEMDFTSESGAFQPPAIPSLIPQSALELKQTFQDALQAAEASQGQQQQLQGMVPIVLVAKLRSQVMAAASRASPKLTPEELGLGSNHPLDFLLLDSPLGGPLGLDTLLEGDPVMALKHEERKCPYCPDRFHNGIGLANHVRGHLNRVGVSYNVRHFISAEEVKAIERRFSFQKKKKKVANFDPGTFSLMRCDFCGAGFDTRAGLSSHARAHLRDFGITNWELTISPINILQELLATSAAELPPSPLGREPSGPPGSFLTSRRPRLPLTMPFPPTWAEDPGPIYGDAVGMCGSWSRAAVGGGWKLGLRACVNPSAAGSSQDLASHFLSAQSISLEALDAHQIALGAPGGAEQSTLGGRGARRSAALAWGGRPACAGAKMAASTAQCRVTKAESKAAAGPRAGGARERATTGAPSPGPPSPGPVVLPAPPPPPPPPSRDGPKAEPEPGPGPGPVPAPAPGLCSEEKTMVAMDLGSPLLPKKSLPVSGALEQVASRLSSRVAAEVPHGSKQELPDLKAQSLTTCEVCGACFETRKGLSSHARSHLRQLGVAESESSGAPIDLLYELVKQKGLPDVPLGLPPSLTKKTNSPKELVAGAARPGLLSLAKPMDVPAVNKAIKSPPGFSAKGLVHASSSPLLKKVPLTLAGSPTPKNPEDKSPQLSLSPQPTSPKAQWSQSEDEGPLNLTLDSDGGRELDCQLCGAWFETRKGLSSHARAHLRHLGVSDPDAKGSPIDVLHGLIRRDGIQIRLPPGRGALAQLGRPPSASTALSLLPPPPPAKKAKLKASGMAIPWGKQDLSAAGIFWASDVEPSPLNLSSGPEPTRDIRCEFCGEFFENRKGLSSHARSHLRQMGVTEWYVNGSPIDTLREILKRRTQSRPGGHLHPPGPSPKTLAKVVGSGGPGSSLEVHSPSDLHISPLAKKLPPPPGSPLGHSPTASPPPTARKVFSGLATPSLPKKLKPEQMRVEIKREMLPGSLHGEPHPSEGPWGTPREDMAPLNLSSRAEPVRDIRCEFCGEFFENRKGLSSHARSHLRQMGVTEWSVNGSPIDTLREILKKKSKLCLIKKEPPAGDLAPALAEDGSPTAAPGAMHSPLPLSPLASRPGKSGTGPTQIPRELNLSPITGAKPSATSYLGPMATKRPLQEDRFLPAEVKTKTYIQTELPFKAKTLHEKTSHSSTEACCELCGLYFENRKALASHARAHLRQFGVTEWCVNGSPIETLSEWIKHRPQKAGAYRSYIQGGRPFTKKFRSAGHGRDTDKRPPLGLAPGGLSLVGRSAGGEPGPEAGRAADSGERPLATSPPGTVKSEEHQRQNINKFERRQARPPDASAARGSEEANDLQQKLEEVRQPPPRVRPVPSLVPRPPQTSLVKFVGNIYTLKCRFCEVEFQGPLSIQEDWVRHLQRHILEMNFSKADPPPEEPQAPQAQTAAVEAP